MAQPIVNEDLADHGTAPKQSGARARTDREARCS